MSRRSRRYARGVPAVRMSDKERVIVQYITEQFERAYRNANGKPVYARSMDQVMKDLFGVKKFTKTLQRARYNEALMINLMRRLDTQTLWGICRSKEYYRLLCTLVALDVQLVKQGRQYNKLSQVEMAERPVKKLRRLSKSIKRSRKIYKTVIRTLQDIFGIERISENSGKNAILDSLEDWLDHHEYGDDYDIFYDLDGLGSGLDSLQSMDEFVARSANRHGRRAAPRTGALGIFNGDGDIFDDDGDDDEYDIFADIAEDERPVRQSPQRRPAAAQPPRQGGAMTLEQGIVEMIRAINDGFAGLNDKIDGLYDDGYGDDDDGSMGFSVTGDGFVGPLGGGADSSQFDGTAGTARTIAEMRAVQEAQAQARMNAQPTEPPVEPDTPDDTEA